MKYFKREIINSPIPYSLRAVPDTVHLHPDRLYQSITIQEGEELKRLYKNIFIENDWKRVSFSTFLPTKDLLKISYEYIYMKQIWYLINQLDCKYYWLNPKDYIFHNGTGHDPTQFNNPFNSYLREHQNNHKGLGKDILEKGMYFPFFITPTEKDNEKIILLGKHRLYSLLLNEDLIKDKLFLFIELPFIGFPNRKSFSPKNDQIDSPIFIYQINKDYEVYNYPTRERLLIFEQFLHFNDELPELMYDYQNYIFPNKIINDANSLKTFLENPFKEVAALELRFLD